MYIFFFIYGVFISFQGIGSALVGVMYFSNFRILVFWHWLLFLLTQKNIGSVSWVHHLLRSVRGDDCWFKRYVMACLLLHCPFFSYVTLFFCFLDLGTAHRAVIYRWQQAIPPSMAFLKSILGFLNFAYTVLVLNYSCVGFMVPLSFSRCLALTLLSCLQVADAMMFWAGLELARDTCLVWKRLLHRNHHSRHANLTWFHY